MYVCASVHRDQRVSDLLDLEFQVVGGEPLVGTDQTQALRGQSSEQ